MFGAAFDDGCRSVSIKSTDEVSLSELKRSKYVESLVGDAFAKVKQALLENRWVLYSGTPCQIAGLKRYLGKNHERLITCDFTCGGLPSHALYEAHLQHLEEKYGAEVESVNFRPKTHGWSIHALRIDFKNQKKYVMPAVLDPFFCGFIRKHVNTRTACYTCRFEKYHESDIILADFWKYHAVIGDKHDNSGISLVLINTEKGERLITEIAPLCELHDIDLETASYNIRERTYSDDYMKLRERYLLECEAGGLQQAAYLIGFPKGVRLLLERLKFFVKGFKRKFQ